MTSKSIHVVLSRYKEPISSQDVLKIVRDNVKSDVDINVVIYDKHELKQDSFKLVPNLGREHYAHIDYILQTWNNPPDYYFFSHPCKADMREDKYKYFVSICKNIDEMLLEGKGSCKASYNCGVAKHWETNFSLKEPWIGNTPSNIEDVKLQEYTVTPFANMKEWWDHTLQDQPYPREQTWCGMCCVSSKNVKARPLIVWQSLFDQVCKGANCEVNHYLERSMYGLVGGE